MPRRRKKRLLRPRTPARVKKTKRAKRARGHQHPELIGLVLAALGVFLSTVVYLGWSGGRVGNWLENGVEAVVGGGVYAVPLALLIVGSLMLARSDLVDVRPFRTGVAVSTVGLLLALGPHGGFGGRALNGAFGTLLGDTGAAIAGGTGLVAGALLLSGASAGALLRRSGTAVRRTAGAARRSLDRGLLEQVEEPAAIISTAPARPPVDAASEFPDVVGISEPAPLIPFPDQDTHESPEQASLFDATVVSKDYELPDRGVLRHSEKRGDGGADTSGHIAQVLMQALADFGVEASVIGQIVGPRVTRYELQLAPGTKMSKVSALKDDLSYALATTEIRILAPIPGKQAVGVEVPNLTPNLVTLGDIYDDLPQTASPLAVWLGKDISGNAVWTDLARMPHILIAGTTGSGKSGCINTILTSVLLRATPDEVRMILIDPKRIELSYYESIPHLLAPVVSSPKEATAVLANVLGEMDRRYERLSAVRARNLPEANRAFRQRGEPQLPYLLVVIDELADLMMISPQAVEDAVIRLAQKSRAVGIHLVLATQRPSVDVITGMIKANVPSRIAFAVSSQTDSRVIIDQGGAESLLGQGDMLFKPLGTSRLQRLQGAYVSEDEIALVVEQCRGQREQELDESLLEAPEPQPGEDDHADEEFDPDEDPLLDRAIEVVVQAQTASTSLLQRRLRVGYTRAGRLIDMLERRGIISGYEGSKPRRVLVDEAALDRVLG
ncbi:MAG TPA: DNA translocase FtsK [Gaiellaceae bacterium]|jgi:S-DNA-T family DNA segregation ATPase FtsK/SpoIIIE|nr:DNA translocase FtsK [Gaiellaceae bacterium]